MRMRSRSNQLTAVLAIASAMVFGQAAHAQSQNLKFEVLSSRPELVTGGDALVKISGVDAMPNVSVDGRDVSSALKADPKGGWIGLVSGLKDGTNKVVAKAGASEQSLTLTNYAINGPLFAGPQQEPFVCEN